MGLGGGWSGFGHCAPVSQAQPEEDEQQITANLAKSFRDCSATMPMFIFSTAIFTQEPEPSKDSDVVMSPGSESLEDEAEGDGDNFWKDETKEACPPAEWPKTPVSSTDRKTFSFSPFFDLYVVFQDELTELVQGAGAVDRQEPPSEEDDEKEEDARANVRISLVCFSF